MKKRQKTKTRNKIIFIVFFIFINNIVFTQNEKLIIGRTTGEINIKKNLNLRVFGFSKSLSGKILLPGTCLNVTLKDTVNIDFWNISQGNPTSLTCKSIDFLQYNREKKLLLDNKPIDHMEHGFYSFIAKKKGTYLYYSPQNYPFNIQAGMFGVIIIRDDKTTNYLNNNEVLWCSNEIDTQWHTDEIMNIEHDDINKKIILPDYIPNYFLINGERAKKVKGLYHIKNKEQLKTIPITIIRLVNAGLYQHEIEFPLDMNIQIVFGKTDSLKKTLKNYIVTLNKGECLELSISLENINKKEQIVYRYINPKSKKVKHKASIPIFY